MKSKHSTCFLNVLHFFSATDMDFQTDCGLFEEQNNQEIFTSPVKDSCFYLTNEDSGLGMDIVSSIFSYYPPFGRPVRPSIYLPVRLLCL